MRYDPKPPPYYRLPPKKPNVYYPLLPHEPRFFRRDMSGRPTVNSTPLYCYTFIYAINTDTGVVGYNSSGNTFIGYNNRTLIVNKDWRTKVAKHLDAGSLYTRYEYQVKPLIWSGTSVDRHTGVPVRNYSFGALTGQLNLQDTSDDVLKDIALSRLKKKLSSSIGDVSLLPPLAESREIHGLIHDINGFTKDMLQALLAVKQTKGKSILKQAGKIWLFFNFGVNPLVSDLAKAANSINDYVNRSDHRQRLTGSASKKWSTTISTSSFPIATTTVLLAIKSSGKHQLSYRYKGAASLNLRSDASYGVADHLGLTWEQLPSALWELTPYSWVVDYFSTVGAWLDDVFYALPGKLDYLCLNRRYMNETTFTPTQTFGWPLTTSAIHYKNGYSKFFSFSREILTTLPTRQLRVRSFDEIGKYGLSKVLNLASVLAGHYKYTPNTRVL